ncbi:hypothetical protein F4780DRAFT_254889 [Xylariomycetidae sp. FL0641]|nr:hypothetical protein F4780DRAFT_254889 [Xylariomycetidae sp. FL0641]
MPPETPSRFLEMGQQRCVFQKLLVRLRWLRVCDGRVPLPPPGHVAHGDPIPAQRPTVTRDEGQRQQGRCHARGATRCLLRFWPPADAGTWDRRCRARRLLLSDTVPCLASHGPAAVGTCVVNCGRTQSSSMEEAAWEEAAWKERGETSIGSSNSSLGSSGTSSFSKTKICLVSAAAAAAASSVEVREEGGRSAQRATHSPLLLHDNGHRRAGLVCETIANVEEAAARSLRPPAQPGPDWPLDARNLVFATYLAPSRGRAPVDPGGGGGAPSRDTRIHHGVFVCPCAPAIGIPIATLQARAALNCREPVRSPASGTVKFW